ncbi:hypothetical protein [Flintibacter muris]|uniref:hypothetical protein n=1 Tax=Flintibacter muris TaxID=2941327 RepID=UPI00203B3499|nr:hypothetical protein [Flintibacter muris]
MKNFSNTGGMRLFFYVGEINFGAAGRDGPGAPRGKAPANGVPSCPALQIRLDVLNIDVVFLHSYPFPNGMDCATIIMRKFCRSSALGRLMR